MQKMFLIICALAVDVSLKKAKFDNCYMPESSERINYPDTKKKAELTRALFKGVNDGQYSCVLPCFFPDRPGRPNKPELLAPKHVPRRRISTGRTGRVALLLA